MSNDIQKDIAVIIEQHLPKQLGDTLQKRFTELEAKEKELEKVQARLLYLEQQARGQDSINIQKGKLRDEQEKIIARETAVTKREHDLDLEILKIKLEESEKRGAVSKELVMIVFKNPTFKTVEQHFGSENIPVNTSGGGSYLQQGNYSGTKESRSIQED